MFTGFVKGLQVDVGVLLLEVESRAQAHSVDTTTTTVDSELAQRRYETVAQLNCVAIKSKICALAANVADETWVLRRQSI